MLRLTYQDYGLLNDKHMLLELNIEHIPKVDITVNIFEIESTEHDKKNVKLTDY